MPPFSGQLNNEINQWIQEFTPQQTGYILNHGKYCSINKIKRDNLLYLQDGELSGQAIEYIGPDGAGLMGVFWYSISGQIWRKTMNFVVDTERENWRNKDWKLVN